MLIKFTLLESVRIYGLTELILRQYNHLTNDEYAIRNQTGRMVGTVWLPGSRLFPMPVWFTADQANRALELIQSQFALGLVMPEDRSARLKLLKVLF